MAKADSLGTALRQTFSDKVVALTILVSALGYFVDVFDLLLFSILRVQSLKALGVDEADLLSVGVRLLNAQMAGLLLGGVVWGVIGDKYGRVSVLFGSITFYSLGSIANAFVHTIGQYEVMRFITGFGLAGELGICVTLASELLPARLRGLGTSFIAAVGVLGAAAAAAVSTFMDWRTAYIVGGALGLCLLALRMGLRESHLYRKMEDTAEKKNRGNVLMFFRDFSLLARYLKVVLIGAPIWAIIGLFITFTPEFAKDFGMVKTPTPAMAILVQNIGASVGMLIIGVVSQRLQSRRKAIAISIGLSILSVILFTTVRTQSLAVYYLLCAGLGIGISYWALAIQLGAEQFGTNLRATAATSIPNFIRALAIPATMLFREWIPSLGVTKSGVAVLTLTFVAALLALWRTQESFHTDLDYMEGKK